MDERKRNFKFLKTIVFLFIGGFFTFSIYASYIYLSLTQIKDPKKCFTTSMYEIHLCSNNSNYVRYKEVPILFFRSLILAEDASFYSHKGLDWFEIKESFRRNISEWRFARGGSTITQQLAKNLYLTKAKSINRKIKEFFLAQQIEKFLSKSQILEKYVNVVEFGPQIFGLRKAARYYFDKNPDSLNVLESAYLVSLLPSPVRYGKSFDDKKLSRINISRMKIILGRLYRTKRITDEIYVFCETLIDTYDWPFPHYNNPFPQQEGYESIEDEILKEFNDGETFSEKHRDEYEDEIMEAAKETLEENKDKFEPLPEESEDITDHMNEEAESPPSENNKTED